MFIAIYFVEADLNFLNSTFIFLLLLCSGLPTYGNELNHAIFREKLLFGRARFLSQPAVIGYACHDIITQSNKYAYIVETYADTTTPLESSSFKGQILTPMNSDLCTIAKRKDFKNAISGQQCLFGQYMDFLEIKRNFLNQISTDRQSEYFISALLKKERSVLATYAHLVYRKLSRSTEPESCPWTVDMRISKKNHSRPVFLSYDDYMTNNQEAINQHILDELDN